MAKFTEYDQFDGLGLAEQVREKNISPKELCEEAISRAEAVNPKLNAIIVPMYELARERVKSPLPDGPFSGVPFLLKDAHHAFKGVSMSCGSEALKNFVPQYDAEIVKRFKDAGVVIIGKTNTPEFKLSYVTEPKVFGPTRNPWQPEYSSGGSSGGSAAAVAARIVPFASATDEGGSIRVPSSYCGLFGFKPSRGRNPVGPNFDEEWDGMSTSHIITRSVRDSAAMLDATMGAEPGAPYTIATPMRSYIDELSHEPGRLRIAFNTRPAYGKEVHPECIKAVEEAAKLLESLGHHVKEAEPDYQEEDAALSFVMVMMGHVASRLEKIADLYNRSVARRQVEPQNYVFARIGRSLSALDFLQAKLKWRNLGYTMAQFYQQYDLLLTPTLGQPPVLVGSQEPSGADRITMKVISSFIGKLILSSRSITHFILKELVNSSMEGQMPFTLIANIAGLPAMSMPLSWTDSGLPCGVQFIGPLGEEATLFRIAAQLEQAQPWVDRKPKICS